MFPGPEVRLNDSCGTLNGILWFPTVITIISNIATIIKQLYNAVIFMNVTKPKFSSRKN